MFKLSNILYCKQKYITTQICWKFYTIITFFRCANIAFFTKCTRSWRLRLPIHSRNCVCTLFTPDLYLSNNRPVHLPIWFQQGKLGSSCKYLPISSSICLYRNVSAFLCTNEIKIRADFKFNSFFRLISTEHNRIVIVFSRNKFWYNLMIWIYFVIITY